jgi:penicillin-binding protein 1A
MASAYGVFANSGVRNPATGILKVENKDGDVLEEYQDNNGGEVIPKQIALQVNDILSDNDARAPMFGKKSSLYIEGRQVAVKTGTTNSYRDAWIIGYTPSFVTAIWVGNNDNTPMAEKASSTLSGPMWNEYMRAILPKYPNENFEKPAQIAGYENLKPVLRGIWQGGESFVVDKISGLLATEFTPTETRDEKVISNVHDILYWINKDDPLGEIPSDPKQDPQFSNWETAVQNWWASHSYLYPQNSPIKPTEYDNIHTEQSKPQIVITSPTNSTSLGINSPITVSATMSGQYPPQKMDVFVNGNYIGTSNNYPFNYSFTPNELSGINPGDDLEIRTVIYDSVYNQNESSVSVSVVE